MKKMIKNISAIFGLILISIIAISTIPFYITESNVGYSLGLLLSKVFGLERQYFMYLILQLVVIIFVVLLITKKTSKIISIMSFVIAFITINAIVFIHIGLSSKAGLGSWLLLLSFLLIGLNYFVVNNKEEDKMMNKKRKNENLDEVVNSNNKLKKISSLLFKNKQNVVMIICIIITVFSLTFAFSKNSNNTYMNNDNNSNENTNNITDGNDNKLKTVMLNESFTIDDVATITFDSITVVDEVKPPLTNSVYSYYEDKVGEKYIVLKGVYKNLLTTTFNSYDNFNGKLLLNNKYEYTSVQIDFVNNNSNDFYSEPTSLQTMTAYIWVSVPDDTINTNNSFSFYLDFIGGNKKNETIKIDFKK